MMLVTAVLSATVAVAYILLGTVRFAVATESVLAYAYRVGVPDEFPPWFPHWARFVFPSVFRLSARIFFLGCAYTHGEIAAHGLLGELPADYGTVWHLIPMFLQTVGAWAFVYTLTLVSQALLHGDE